jgi:hypothetical protein
LGVINYIEENLFIFELHPGTKAGRAKSHFYDENPCPWDYFPQFQTIDIFGLELQKTVPWV